MIHPDEGSCLPARYRCCCLKPVFSLVFKYKCTERVFFLTICWMLVKKKNNNNNNIYIYIYIYTKFIVWCEGKERSIPLQVERKLYL